MFQVPDGCVDVWLKKVRYWNEFVDWIEVGDAHIYTSDRIDLGPSELIQANARDRCSRLRHHARKTIDPDLLTEC
jgi:hypothetical protein